MTTPEAQISPIEEIIAAAKAGEAFVLVDDEDRENEGDIIVPACKITPEIIKFMACEGRGLICLALSQEYAEKLELPLMPRRNCDDNSTAFTYSIDARWGIDTGISAADRAHTIQQVVRKETSAQDFVVPGHVFPLIAKKGGVLSRNGHTEGAVDIAELAGLEPVGVICEVMNDDGTMSRMPDLKKFCAKHGLKMGTIADLVAYKKKNSTPNSCVA